MKVELAGVSKVFGGKRALNQIRLEIPAGRIVAVVGLNGAGKTTLLHCLAGILALTEGAILYDDQPFTRDRVDLRKRFGFLPDFPLFFQDFTALQHIAMALRLYEKDGPGAEERVLGLLRAFDLMPYATVPMNTLSRGQVYKVALTALMLVAPELWILDEPMASGMDALGLREFRDRASAATNAGATVIYTTQIMSVAEQFSDEVVVLHEGRVHAHGAGAEIRERGDLETLLADLHESA